MEYSHERMQRSYLKIILVIFAGLTLFGAGCWAAFHFYEDWQERKLLARAGAYLDMGNNKDAALAARRILQFRPESVAGTRIMADVAERSGDRIAVELRRRVLELQPDSTDNAIALAKTALLFNDLPAAEAGLGRVPEAARNSAAYLATKARLALGKDPAAAEQHLLKAVAAAPGDPALRFQLAALQLKSADPETQERARATLQELRNDAGERCAATRVLLGDAIARGEDSHRIRGIAHELQSYPEAQFRDRILYLGILHQMRDEGFAGYLTRLQNEAADKPPELGQLFAWMNESRLSLVALDFAKSLPKETLETWPLPRAIAEAYVNLADWPALELATREANWGSTDYLRRAFLTRALRQLKKDGPAEREWTAAKKEASARGASLLSLMRLASSWGWRADAVELLWGLTKFDENKVEALHTLYQHYRQAQDTAGLYRVLSRLIENAPGNVAVQNNLAQVSLLLNADMERSRRTAAEIYQREPSNAAYAATHAFALHTKGDTRGALAIMETLPPEKLREPSVAAYYGIFLAAAGNAAKAAEFLDLAKTADLLPEEKELVAKSGGS